MIGTFISRGVLEHIQALSIPHAAAVAALVVVSVRQDCPALAMSVSFSVPFTYVDLGNNPHTYFEPFIMGSQYHTGAIIITYIGVC